MLTQYLAVRSQLRPGDVVMFWANAINPLSGLIELATGGPSHSAIVRQAATASADVIITQSTLDSEGNGVRSNPLGATIAGYPAGSKAAALLLDDATRARIDWQKFYAYIGSIDGIVKYSVPELFEFLLPAALDRGEPTKERVCSVAVGSILDACGAISHVNWGMLSPQSIVELGIYRTWAPLLGDPKLKSFNTI